MTSWIQLAFAIIHRELPGRWSALEAHMKDAKPAVQHEFFRVIQAFDDELTTQKHQSRQLWRRP